MELTVADCRGGRLGMPLRKVRGGSAPESRKPIATAQCARQSPPKKNPLACKHERGSITRSKMLEHLSEQVGYSLTPGSSIASNTRSGVFAYLAGSEARTWVSA